MKINKKTKWKYYETDLTCNKCEEYLYYREPEDYDPKNDDQEYLFLDQVVCIKCKKAFFYLDAFFYSLPSGTSTCSGYLEK